MNGLILIGAFAVIVLVIKFIWYIATGIYDLMVWLFTIRRRYRNKKANEWLYNKSQEFMNRGSQ